MTLRGKIYAGVPNKYRAEVWSQLFQARTHADQHEPSYFAELCARGLSSDHSSQIELDVIRTFADTKQFGENGVGRDQLRKVLNCFAWHRPEVGYCQGLSYVAATLLMHMQPQEAFWCLVSALDTHKMKSVFDGKLSGLVQIGAVFELVLQWRMPKLAQALSSRSIPPLMYITPWFMTVFTHLSLPWNVVFRIWDAFALEGLAAVYRVSLSILSLLEDQLMLARPGPHGLEDALPLLLNLPKAVANDADQLMAAAHQYDSSLVNDVARAHRELRAEADKRAAAAASRAAGSSGPATPRIGRSLFEKVVQSLPSLTTPRKNMPRSALSLSASNANTAHRPAGVLNSSNSSKKRQREVMPPSQAARSTPTGRASKLRMTASRRSFLDFSTPKQSPIGGSSARLTVTAGSSQNSAARRSGGKPGLSPPANRTTGAIELVNFSANKNNGTPFPGSLTNDLDGAGTSPAVVQRSSAVYARTAKRLSPSAFGSSPATIRGGGTGSGSSATGSPLITLTDISENLQLIHGDDLTGKRLARKRSSKAFHHTDDVNNSECSSQRSSYAPSPVISRRRRSSTGLNTPVGNSPGASRRPSPLAQMR